ncbi:hypothetical protein JH06_3128 [Blastocystis sp. subtype 4]|uniref:hypothetical protein n=1 Tax=Blastocystis sp. subtype 4 TaxID=944170 RepID=UPI00071163A0|nr:hypothetical protein JH06_3128 [Blastocystis sp. subtype 4]KNB44852.1 hypothetical protein JH06_3128 [Blastocystis sp. subtype 4]|eukprot:XP_014528295.1 hypothetical protein JH06_3128 [Blastocystis sp. subtype 4]
MQIRRQSRLHNPEVSLDEPIDALEVFSYLRTIQDPEYPMNLEQLNLASISVDNDNNKVVVYFTPTIPNCTQAAVIGLCIRVKLDRCLPRRLKSRVYITPGSHNTEESLNRQINDKERVAAALENPSLHILFVHLMLWLNENQGY